MSEKLYTAIDLVTILRDHAETDITQRTAQRWLEDYPTANGKEKPREYTEETILQVINEHRKGNNFSKDIPLEIIQKREQAIKNYENNYDEIMNNWADSYSNLQNNEPQFYENDVKDELNELSIKIMLKALLNLNGLVFHEEELKKDLVKVREEEFYNENNIPEYSAKYFLSKDRLKKQEYVTKKELY